MADRPQSSTSRIMTLFFLALFAAILWFGAPFVLPMYRWLHVDFAKEAQKAVANGYKVTEAQLRTKYKIEFSYQPRGDGDPRPFVLLKMTPDYYSVVPEDDWSFDEENLLLRCSIINDKTGEPPSKFHYVSNNYKDRFFVAEAWRFPPKALGKTTGDRPLFLYDSMTFDKMSIGDAQIREEQIKNATIWTPDDDGWKPPEAAAE